MAAGEFGLVAACSIRGKVIHGAMANDGRPIGRTVCGRRCDSPAWQIVNHPVNCKRCLDKGMGALEGWLAEKQAGEGDGENVERGENEGHGENEGQSNHKPLPDDLMDAVDNVAVETAQTRRTLAAQLGRIIRQQNMMIGLLERRTSAMTEGAGEDHQLDQIIEQLGEMIKVTNQRRARAAEEKGPVYDWPARTSRAQGL